MDWLTMALVVLLAVALMAIAWLVARIALFERRRPVEAQSGLAVLGGQGSSREKAEAFIALMKAGEVRVHTITNKGESYRDARQSELFKAGLTDSHMAALLSIVDIPR